MSYKALVLFDIDGTLTRRAGPHHRDALVEGIRRVTGLDTTTEGIPVQGMLDPVILATMMRRAGASGVGDPRGDAGDHARRGALLPSCLPGAARQALPRSGAGTRAPDAPYILLALVTGNLTRIGWRKLERAGLRDYFRFGAFGEMAKTRAGLAKLAIRQARREKPIVKYAPISLIGDATSDIIAAHANSIRAISVRTGITPVEELVRERPDVLLRDLRELRLRMVEMPLG